MIVSIKIYSNGIIVLCFFVLIMIFLGVRLVRVRFSGHMLHNAHLHRIISSQTLLFLIVALVIMRPTQLMCTTLCRIYVHNFMQNWSRHIVEHILVIQYFPAERTKMAGRKRRRLDPAKSISG